MKKQIHEYFYKLRFLTSKLRLTNLLKMGKRYFEHKVKTFKQKDTAQTI